MHTLDVEGTFVGSELVTPQTLSHSEGGVNPAKARVAVRAKKSPKEGGASSGGQVVHCSALMLQLGLHWLARRLSCTIHQAQCRHHGGRHLCAAPVNGHKLSVPCCMT